MTLTHLFLSFLLVISSLAVAVSATDAGSYGYGYGSKPNLEKPKVEKPTGSYGYGSKPNLEKPKVQELTGTYGYVSKPNLEKPNVEELTGSYGYGLKPNLEKPKKDEKQFTGSYGYGSKPNFEKPKVEKKQLPTTIGVQGLVYCKVGPKLVPIQGAVARVTCLAVDENGYERAPFSVLSDETDEKGYFFTTLSPSELEENWKLSECKTFLENSPLESCNVPTDVNRGMSGCLLSSNRLLPNKKVNLYSVGPFFYTSEPKPINGGY